MTGAWSIPSNWSETLSAREQIQALQERMQQSIIGQETVAERLAT